ncbi:MAG: valine--tRNA ligase [Actinomycetota bacterium]|nr:valine--tRNA ligase [Actinomycetota bacterium]
MEPLYKPGGVEERWQRTWEEEGLYNAEADDPREPFVICLPPPNVTDRLHMGHALNASAQDVLIRWHRMRDFNALWQPGYDHAGIALQTVMRRRLAAEGKSLQDVGREEFVRLCWDFIRDYGGQIMGQLRTLGASLDYRRHRFTMDEQYTRAVMRFFAHLYGKGYIYRGTRIVNWCPGCASTVSDLEVNHIEVDDTLTWIRYPLAQGDGHVTIATVRPPTMLADVAVAVHPDDERYRGLVGKEAIVPIAERVVPIIADERVDPEFGTGAVKITPGHDPMDWEIGRDHNLPEPMVIGLDGRMTAEAGELAGLTQEEAEERIVAQLEERGLLEKREPFRHSVGHCDRSGDRIEPLVLLQWWVEMEELAKPAIAALREGRVRTKPEQQTKVMLSYLENIRPWCISRQLWWGHRIPVWYCPDGHVTVGESEPKACGECGSAELRQDEDVLDTWFSSALWPFATLGWPEQTPDLETFYPGDVCSTGRDINFLWVSRMIWAGIEMLGEPPFEWVNYHSMILATDGRRMSKSLGTGVDPTDLIAEHGADATRYGLLKMSSSQDVRFSPGQIEEGRKLANKLWNVSRLILENAGDAKPELRPQALEERWIVARLDSAQRQLSEHFAQFEFAAAANVLYHVTFDDFCDWYAEAIKPRLYEGDADAQSTALANLERLLKLLHPLMPHVTEEIWSNLPGRQMRLIVAPWPEPTGADDMQLEFEPIQSAAEVFRRAGIRPRLNDEQERIFASVVKPERVKADGGNVEAEVERLRGEIARAESMLANERFVGNAPEEVVAAERAKLERYRRELDALSA